MDKLKITLLVFLLFYAALVYPSVAVMAVGLILAAWGLNKFPPAEKEEEISVDVDKD